MLLMILLAVVLIIAISALLIFRTGKVPVANVPVMDYKALLEKHIPYYSKLNPELRQRFEHQAARFLQRVHIEGVGFELTDADRIMIAASAIIPILNFEDWEYSNLTNVIIYPDTFNNDFQYEGSSTRDMMGLVGSGFMNGQMLLSRSALIKGFSSNAGKENVAIHEFVHLIDNTDGATDGTPERLMDHEAALPWLKMMHQEMHRIEAGKSDINPYALTNEAEFLAVVSEYFFEKPEQFSTKHPELYQALSAMFRQQPAGNAVNGVYNG